MQNILSIDGNLYEGGGQMIRSSIALSIITHKPFKMHSIRQNRRVPGINDQHQSLFKAYSSKVPHIGDLQLQFHPQILYPKQVINETDASTTLMMQCVVPVLTFLNNDQQIQLIGSTDLVDSPPTQSVQYGLIPLLRQIGVNLIITDIKRGYAPLGQGYLKMKVQKGQYINPITIKEVGIPQKIMITYYIKDENLPESSKKFVQQIKKILHQYFRQDIKLETTVKVEKIFDKMGDEYGIGGLILGENLIWDVGRVGQKITQQFILKKLQEYCQRKIALDQFHQDQLLIYLSLANGTSQLMIGKQQSPHTKGLIYVIKSFIPDAVFEHDLQTGILKIKGIGLKRQFRQQKQKQ